MELATLHCVFIFYSRRPGPLYDFA